ncbi:hypothetical protein KVT40_001482 [Elsinoe batatas]|uniref:Uncharacterized protein n=1 Tax=Elsinoe batatas TaxID=2601811 RepID=A0A8K0PJT5_9PEZI|nr:hypothetical protein KVT40_001482 [Elsinoe batatas]
MLLAFSLAKPPLGRTWAAAPSHRAPSQQEIVTLVLFLKVQEETMQAAEAIIMQAEGGAEEGAAEANQVRDPPDQHWVDRPSSFVA